MAEERRFTGLLDDQGNHIYEGDVVLWRAGFGVQGDIDKAFYQAKTVRFWERKKGSSYESRWLLDTIHNYWFRDHNAARRWPKVDITRGEDIKL
jgi:hypothetical protein